MSLAHINMNQPRVRGVCPLILSRALSPASPPRPPGCPRAPALGARVERCTCAGRLFPVRSGRTGCTAALSHRPPLPSQRPKVCSLHLCLFCRPVSRTVLVTLVLSTAEYTPNLMCHVNPKASFTDFTVLSTGFHFYTCFSKLKVSSLFFYLPH